MDDDDDRDQSTTSSSRRKVLITKVSSTWLFNRLQTDSGMILIDTRSRELYDKSSIRSAISVVAPNDNNMLTMDFVISNLVAEEYQQSILSRRNLMEIVIITNDECSWTKTLANILKSEGLVTAVKITHDPFCTFQSRYPFLCTDFVLGDNNQEQRKSSCKLLRTKSGTHTVSFPNEVLDDFLYLGNMWQASQLEVITLLKITHIINASQDVKNVFASNGVHYLNIDIKDKPESDIYQFLSSTSDFIDSAKMLGNTRVLVHCTQGISRSATIVIDYLMKSQRWSLVTAVNHTISCRGVIYPNTGFISQLRAVEASLYDGTNSVQLSDLDSLRAGSMPSCPAPSVTLSSKSTSSSTCIVCNRSFGIFNGVRRHYCHNCNNSVCSKCSPLKLVLSHKTKQQRTCNSCIISMEDITLDSIEENKVDDDITSITVRTTDDENSGFVLHFVAACDDSTTTHRIILNVIRIRFRIAEEDVLECTDEETGSVISNFGELKSNTTVLVSTTIATEGSNAAVHTIGCHVFRAKACFR